jgi:hypothetical protein
MHAKYQLMVEMSTGSLKPNWRTKKSPSPAAADLHPKREVGTMLTLRDNFSILAFSNIWGVGMMNNESFVMNESIDLSGLQTVLLDAGFTEENVSGLIKRCATNRGYDLSSMLRLTEGPQRLNRLLRLFVLGHPVPETAIRDALTPFPLEKLAATGLVRIGQSGEVTSQVCILPYGETMTLRDFGADWTGRTTQTDYVMGVSASSISLALITVRRQGEEVLDLGTGGGFQAMLAARHARRVIGTDINPRALALARLAMRINGIANVELRQGSMFDPVPGQTFDLIVSQPPFVISPENTKIFRDSGMPGDTFCEQILRQAPNYLREDGWGSVIFSWGHRNDDHWSDRPRTWVEGCGCDGWILRLRADDVFSYAVQWIGGTEDEGEGPHIKPLDKWLAYYEEMGFETISTGVAVLHKRMAGKNWVRVDALEKQDAQGPCGSQIQNVFAAETLLRSLPDPGPLLDVSLRMTEDHEMQQTLTLASGAWQIKDTQLIQRRGFAFPCRIDRMSAEFLSLCDGSRTVRSVVESLAQRFSLDFQRLSEEAIPIAVRFMKSGYLVPV